MSPLPGHEDFGAHRAANRRVQSDLARPHASLFGRGPGEHRRGRDLRCTDSDPIQARFLVQRPLVGGAQVAVNPLLGQRPGLGEARAAGISKRRLYKLRDDGQIEQLGHGLFQRIDRGQDADIDLIEIAIWAPKATLCLATALARHELTDEIPAGIDIALPRGQWKPATRAPAIWHSFNPATFDLGREPLELTTELSIGLYSPERSIIDAFRLRHREGSDLAIGALKRWLRLPSSKPATLLRLAARFPRTQPALRTALALLA